MHVRKHRTLKYGEPVQLPRPGGSQAPDRPPAGARRAAARGGGPRGDSPRRAPPVRQDQPAGRARGVDARLLAFTRGHPQRTLLLAHHLYNLLEDSTPPGDAAGGAIELAIAETRDAHQAMWDAVGRVERIVLMALAGGQAPTGTRIAEEHRIARSTLREALERLLHDERIVRRDDQGKPFLLDPLLAEWLIRR